MNEFFNYKFIFYPLPWFIQAAGAASAAAAFALSINVFCWW